MLTYLTPLNLQLFQTESFYLFHFLKESTCYTKDFTGIFANSILRNQPKRITKRNRMTATFDPILGSVPFLAHLLSPNYY